MRGAQLVVELVDIQLDETGFQLIGPNRAIVRDEVPEWDCYLVRVHDGTIHLPRGLELPAEPMIGTLGNAPAGEPTLQPGRHGGNLDCPQIRIGARVYLPIEVEGAMFYLGDVHARQGDGEVVGAPEIGARVTVRFGVLDRAIADWPLVEDADHWHIVASAPNEEEAIRQGVFAAAPLDPGTALDLLQRRAHPVNHVGYVALLAHRRLAYSQPRRLHELLQVPH